MNTNDISKKIQIYNTPLSFLGNRSVVSKGNNMPEDIANIINSIKGAANHDEVRELLNTAAQNEEIEKIDSLMYRSGNYIISDMLKFRGEPESKFLEGLSKKNINIAPKFVDAIHNGDHTILITKIDGMEGEDLIPFSQGYDKLDNEAKTEAFRDVKKLVQAGIINQAIFARGNGALFITPKTNKVIIPDWNMMRPIDSTETQSILNDVHSILFRK